ncbi:MAG: hypothetical protein JOZ38_02385, partial [Candidatus Eremiobacteraeota bacterium]|nr:hypothetical protein [Candidatus Eremiobacteraeota bacterium]
MTALDWLILLVGTVIVVLALRDVFASVIVPRAVNRRGRVSPLMNRALWRLWPWVGYRIREDGKREDFFASFAPFSLVAILAVWVAMLIFGFGLAFFGLRQQLSPHPATIWAAMYFAGSSILTIG